MTKVEIKKAALKQAVKALKGKPSNTAEVIRWAKEFETYLNS